MAAELLARQPALQLLYGGRRGGFEEPVVLKAGLPFIGLPGRPLASSSGAIRAVASLVSGVVQARMVLRREKPDIVIGTGGYASTALCLAQGARRKPLVILEGNAIPGRTNRLLSRSATYICTAFEASHAFFPKSRAVVTGFPVRPEFASPRDPSLCRRQFGLDERRFTLLVVGGSQGAKALNDIVAQAASSLVDAGVQILHQVGTRNADESFPDIPGWRRLDYIEDMASAYRACDLVVSRAGASTLAEMGACGSAGILVPYPFAQANHQMANAMELASLGAALVSYQNDLTPERLLVLVRQLRDDRARLARMQEAMQTWAKPDAAARVAGLALTLLNDGKLQVSAPGSQEL